jgi:sulfatase modifying factor 1
MAILIKTGKAKYRAEPGMAVNAKDGTVLVWVPPGEFEMGDGQDANCPKHKVWLDGYWMGVYCVTNAQYSKFVAEGKGREPDNQLWKDAKLTMHPVVNVSWDDAMGYAKWAGLALPTEAQWEKACRGPKGLLYPWGNEWDEKRCRNDKTKGNEETAAVGAYAAGVSGYGTYQQSGNVWEWCADWYGDKYYTEKGVGKNPTGPATGSARVRHGGCWVSDVASYSYFRGARRCIFAPAVRFVSQGFRLVRMVS